MSEVIVPIACAQSVLAYVASSMMYGRGEVERNIAGVMMVITPTILMSVFSGTMSWLDITASLIIGSMAVGFGKLYRMYEDRRNDECLH